MMPMEGNMVRLMRRCQLAKITKVALMSTLWLVDYECETWWCAALLGVARVLALAAAATLANWAGWWHLDWITDAWNPWRPAGGRSRTTGTDAELPGCEAP